MPLQSVDGLSCAEGYMIDTDYYDDDRYMGKCVPNPDYVNPYEKTITDLIGIEPTPTTTTTSETTSEPTTINISFSVDTLPILLIIIFIIIAIIAIRRNFG